MHVSVQRPVVHFYCSLQSCDSSGGISLVALLICTAVVDYMPCTEHTNHKFIYVLLCSVLCDTLTWFHAFDIMVPESCDTV